MLDLPRASALTFDCYGTLIDWETGLLAALRRMLGSAAARASDDDLLSRHAVLERQAQAGPYRPYRDVLADVAQGFGRAFGVAVSKPDLAASIADWPAFADTPAAFTALSIRYRLMVVSNVDRDLFEHTRPKLGVAVEVVTAEDVRSYKPDDAHFRCVIERLGLPRERIVHVAQSLYHDIAPANRLGIASVWVNRRRGRDGSGATYPAEATPDLEVGSLAELARIALPDGSLPTAHPQACCQSGPVRRQEPGHPGGHP